MHEITIYYPSGEIHINLDVYLHKGTITQWKKMIKMCSSDNVDVIHNFLNAYIACAGILIHELTDCITNQKTEIVELEKKIKRLKYWRDGYRRNTVAYNQYNRWLKDAKGELSNLRYSFRDNNRQFKEYERLKPKAEKLLKYVGGEKGD